MTDRQTDRQTDRRTDRQTDDGHQRWYGIVEFNGHRDGHRDNYLTGIETIICLSPNFLYVYFYVNVPLNTV